MNFIYLIIGLLLRILPAIRGRHRLQSWWLNRGYSGAPRIGKTPSAAKLWCDLSIPFEAVVWLGREEWDDTRRLADLLQPGQYFIDVGANIGTWTLEAACHVQATGRVLAFEPNPDTAAKLKANVVLNDMDEIIHVQTCAVSSEPGYVAMTCATEHNLSHVVPSDSPGAATIPAVTLDEHLGANNFVHGMKIDVEGHELAVLSGGIRIIERCKPWIIVEFNLDLCSATRLGEWDVHRWLVSHGYAAEPMPSTYCPIIDDNYRPHVVRYANILYRPVR